VARDLVLGRYRYVSNIPHGFAIQSLVAELAAAAGRDSKDYLLESIGPSRRIDPRKMSDSWNYTGSPVRYPLDTGRLRRMIETAAQQAQWGRPMPARQGLGIAAHSGFLSCVAAVIEVAVNDKGELSIPRVDIALDCGPIGQSGTHPLATRRRLRDGTRECCSARSPSRPAVSSRTTSTTIRSHV
jgi:isoquinoline 1-oxidoreductase beta subunit